MNPKVILRQALALGDDLQRPLEDLFDQALQILDQLQVQALGPAPAVLETVYLTGCGDSYHAALSARCAFQQLAGVEAIAIDAGTLASGLTLPESRRISGRVALIAVSASGRTDKVAQALSSARSGGLPTIAVCGARHEPVAQTAEATLLMDLPHNERSPGVRTYQASLLGMILLALALGVRRGAISEAHAQHWLTQIGGLGRSINVWGITCRERCEAIAARLARVPFVFVAGSGPGVGPAMHGAAKLIECAGMLAVAREAEEWWHVDRFVHAPEAPLLVFATEGQVQAATTELARRASGVGRPLVLIAPRRIGDSLQGDHTPADLLACPDGVPQVLAALLLGVPAAMLAAATAIQLGRRPFLGRA